MKKATQLGLAILLGIVAVNGNLFAAQSLQNSKDAVTQTVIAEPTHHKHTTVPFDGQRLSSKAGSTGGTSTSVAMDRMKTCSKHSAMNSCGRRF